MTRCARESCRRWRPDIWMLNRVRPGVRFEEDWYCSRACLEAIAHDRLCDATVAWSASGVIGTPPRNVMRLGTVLLHQRAVDAAALKRALDAQKRSGLKLGAQLVRMKLVTPDDVVRALAAQAGIGYLPEVDPALVRGGPGGLSRDAVRALGVVPIDANVTYRRLKVACAAPVPRLALAALRELTGFAVDPFIVSDETCRVLLEEYRTTSTAAPVAVLRPASVVEATAHIARAVETGRAVRVQQARCDPFVVVRLEGEACQEDLLLPVTMVAREVEQRVHL